MTDHTAPASIAFTAPTATTRGCCGTGGEDGPSPGAQLGVAEAERDERERAARLAAVAIASLAAERGQRREALVHADAQRIAAITEVRRGNAALESISHMAVGDKESGECDADAVERIARTALANPQEPTP